MTTRIPEFLDIQDVLRLHRQSLEEFGGADGLRDPGLLDSALASARNEFHYGQGDLFAVAAAYGFHIAEAQAFIDGNKRTAIGCTLAFLHLNGVRQFPDDQILYQAMIAIASHTMGKQGLADLFRSATSLGAPGFQEAAPLYPMEDQRVDTRLARGAADVDFSEISIEAGLPGIHLIQANHGRSLRAEAAFVWIASEADRPKFPKELDGSLSVHLGVYSSFGMTLGWLVFKLASTTTSAGQAAEYLVDSSDRRVMDALHDLDRQSHWHIEVRSGAGDRLARYEFENVFGIHRILELLDLTTTPSTSADFLRLKAEFQATYSVQDLLAA